MMIMMKFTSLHLFCLPYLVKSVKVFTSTLTLTEYGRPISGAHLVNASLGGRRLTDVSICMRFNYKLLGNINSGIEGKQRLLTIAKWRKDAFHSIKDNLVHIAAQYPQCFIGFGKGRTFLLRDPGRSDFEVWESSRWSSFCISYEKKIGLLQFVKDGKAMNLNYNHEELTQLDWPEDILSQIYLARCSFDFKGSCSGPEGQVSDFNVWRKPLSLEEMTAFTTCQRMMKGDVVNWDRSDWELVNMTSREATDEEICVPPKPGHILFPENRNSSSLTDLCHKMRGKASAIKDEATQLMMTEQIKRVPQCLKRDSSPLYWGGWTDQAREDEWRAVDGGEPLGRYRPWQLGKPNGDRLENCLEVNGFTNQWNDYWCNGAYCGFCELEQTPDLQIRGLCRDTLFDVRYSWTWKLENGRHSFRGFQDTLLYWDDVTNLWQLKAYSNPNLTASVDMVDYPFGTHEWIIRNDPCYGEDVTEANVILNINACNENEFNCYDGNCVNMTQRCDRILDCPDKSDEIGCDLIEFGVAYIKEVPPPPLVDSEVSTLPINVSIDLLSILDINEVESYIKLQFGLRLTWQDGRLTMLNLKDEFNLNTLTNTIKNEIWIPEVIFHNTQSKLKSLNDAESFITIDRQGDFVRSERSSLQNAFTYQGSENPLTIARVYDIDFICEFDMEFYPFDTQNCSIILVMAGNSGKFVHQVISEYQYLGPVDLTQYFVKDINDTYIRVENGAEAVELKVVFGRRILGTFLTTYLPTFTLCLVAFSTNYFKSFFFEAIVTVNLTALLVLTTLFISVSNSLPKTAYVKMMDVWLIFNLFIPFAEVVIHTYIDSLRDEYDRGVINHHGFPRKVQSERKYSICIC